MTFVILLIIGVAILIFLLWAGKQSEAREIAQAQLASNELSENWLPSKLCSRYMQQIQPDEKIFLGTRKHWLELVKLCLPWVMLGIVCIVGSFFTFLHGSFTIDSNVVRNGTVVFGVILIISVLAISKSDKKLSIRSVPRSIRVAMAIAYVIVLWEFLYGGVGKSVLQSTSASSSSSQATVLHAPSIGSGLLILAAIAFVTAAIQSTKWLFIVVSVTDQRISLITAPVPALRAIIKPDRSDVRAEGIIQARLIVPRWNVLIDAGSIYLESPDQNDVQFNDIPLVPQPRIVKSAIDQALQKRFRIERQTLEAMQLSQQEQVKTNDLLAQMLKRQNEANDRKHFYRPR